MHGGAWEAWLHFFLSGIIDTTEQATRTAQRILELFRNDRARVDKLGIVREMTGRRRSKVYAYHVYLKILGEGAELIK